MSELDPLAVFTEWFSEAKKCTAIADATAMALATASAGAVPSVRMVLLKQFDPEGFVFYTNLDSPKARDLRENPQASLLFHWVPLKRQVRISGTVMAVSGETADQYFASRPRLSQLGAWASKQSTPMPHRFALEPAVAAAALRFGSGDVPRPPNWSGFRVVPREFEFWTEKPFRHHERRVYSRAGDRWEGKWIFP